LIFSPQIFVIVILIVLANSKSPKADGIALPKIAGYNDHITKKERRSRKCTTAPTAVPGTSPTTIWLLYQISSLLKTLKRIFFVRSEEQNLCPYCNEKLKVIGSRKRKYINDASVKITLVIRRLCCCLPDYQAGCNLSALDDTFYNSDRLIYRRKFVFSKYKKQTFSHHLTSTTRSNFILFL
jgi:hypothetical protein